MRRRLPSQIAVVGLPNSRVASERDDISGASWSADGAARRDDGHKTEVTRHNEIGGR
jgi:hypothetical protein